MRQGQCQPRVVHLLMVSAEEMFAPAALLSAVMQHMLVVPKAMGASGWTTLCGSVCRTDLGQMMNDMESLHPVF